MPIATAGALRERVTIEQQVKADDEGGGYSISWTSHSTLWARVESPNGREALIGSQLSAAVSHVVTIRQRDDVRAEMRVMWRGRALNIRSVLPDGRREFLRLICEEGVAV